MAGMKEDLERNLKIDKLKDLGTKYSRPIKQDIKGAWKKIKDKVMPEKAPPKPKTAPGKTPPKK